MIAAPGQGAQTPGFLEPWLEDPQLAARLDWLSTVAGIDLTEHGTLSDAETIRDTAVAQPLLVASALVAALALVPRPGDSFEAIGAVTGHSVGEIAAAAGVGVVSAEQAMVLVRERGLAMAEASARRPTSMTAVIGGDRDEVLARLAELELTAANDNGPGQVVAAGTVEQLDALAQDPPARARLRPLAVAGAFHTEHMRPAVDVLARHARAISVHDSRTPLISNRDGQVVHEGREVLGRLVAQVAHPVRWDLCMATMLDLGVTGMLEMPPAGTLSGIARRAMPGVETFALTEPAQLDDAREFLAKHADGSPGRSAMHAGPTWRLLVSPAKGTFAADNGVGEGDALGVGHEVGVVSSLRDRIPVHAPHGGTIVEWLVEDGDLVSPGQPLLRLHPTGEDL